MASTKTAVLRLYREMMRDAAHYESYNYRNYAFRRIREDFRKNKSLTEGSAEQKNAIQFAREQADILHRQVAISKLYPQHNKSIMDRA